MLLKYKHHVMLGSELISCIIALKNKVPLTSSTTSSDKTRYGLYLHLSSHSFPLFHPSSHIHLHTHICSPPTELLLPTELAHFFTCITLSLSATPLPLRGPCLTLFLVCLGDIYFSFSVTVLTTTDLKAGGTF